MVVSQPFVIPCLLYHHELPAFWVAGFGVLIHEYPTFHVPKINGVAAVLLYRLGNTPTFSCEINQVVQLAYCDPFLI